MSEPEVASAPRRQPVSKAQPDQGVRARKAFDIGETFKIDLGFELSDDLDRNGNPLPLKDANGQPVKRKRAIDGYATPGPHTPAIDESYVFSVEDTKAVLLGIAARDNILLVGDTGVGKTSLIEQIAARINYNVVKISFDGHITREHLVGEWVVRGKEMVFQRGLLVYAMQLPGTIILFDEWDTIDGDCAFVLQRPLQRDDRKLLLLETEGELISTHPENLFVATANTLGHGDDSGLYSSGTKVQNYSQINRWSMTIAMGFMPEDREITMLQKRFPSLEHDECRALVRVVNSIREGYRNGQISVPLSPRDTINWAEKFIRMGDPERAAQYAFVNRMVVQDQQVVLGIVKRVLNSP